jgi:hypothetical protein
LIASFSCRRTVAIRRRFTTVWGGPPGPPDAQCHLPKSEHVGKVWGRMASCAPVVNRRRPCPYSSAPGGLPTRRRLTTCPTTRAEFPFARKLSGIEARAPALPDRQTGLPACDSLEEA